SAVAPVTSRAATASVRGTPNVVRGRVCLCTATRPQVSAAAASSASCASGWTAPNGSAGASVHVISRTSARRSATRTALRQPLRNEHDVAGAQAEVTFAALADVLDSHLRAHLIALFEARHHSVVLGCDLRKATGQGDGLDDRHAVDVRKRPWL